ncbi:C2 calcium/lipid-binding plant phosphoribosyltransferase family protein [Carex rostrata]
MATNRKLIVEIAEAHNLFPKDGTGTSSPYARVDFDGQRRKTRTVPRDLNPTWNEALEFNITAGGGTIDALREPLEVSVFHDVRVGPSRRNCFLGRVRLDSRHFVKKGEEALMYFPLEKKSFFGWVRGEIGLKVYHVDEPVPEPEPVFAQEQDGTDAPVAEALQQEAPAPSSPSPPPPPPPPAEAEAEAQATPPVPESVEQPTDVPESSPQSQPENVTKETENTEATSAEPLVPEPNADLQAPLAPLEQEKVAAPKWVPPPRQVPQPPETAPEMVEMSKYDLVDKMPYLFVRVVRARSLPRDTKPHVRISAYGRHVSTQEACRGAFLEWDQTFAFSRDPSNDSSTLELSVWDLPPHSDVTDAEERQFLGGLCFDIADIPMRDPPDSALATQWYRLEGSRNIRGGDLMLATWIGTQADASFAEAWKADAPPSHVSARSKVYLSPKLWYLRLTVIEAQDTLTAPPPREAGISVRAALGFQVLKTRSAVNRNGGPLWNEDLIFVAAEPFEDERLVLSLEIRYGKEIIVVGSAGIHLSSVERRVDDRKVASRWLDLIPNNEIKKGNKKGAAVSLHGGRLHVRVCLDGGYHVTDELQNASSDFRPSARQIWRPPVGMVELGLIGCKGLLPMRTFEGKGSTDAYAVAKYGPKWARTRTVADCFDPAWNEQYTWPVYDPCTVLTIGVFDDPPIYDPSKDSASISRPMGKVRIRISTLEAGRIYRGCYPLIMMLPTGAKQMGMIELAIRFAPAGPTLDLLSVYGQPTLPLMHHVHPIPALQRDPLRLAAARLTASHLARSEPPLHREVATWMLDATDPRGFSMRKVRANWHRIVSALSWVANMVRWIEYTRNWRNPTSTLLVHGVVILLAWFPELIVPTLALYIAVVGVWKYRQRLRGPVPHPCVRASLAEVADREELDEEFDSVPSSKTAEVVRARYDRARAVGARVQTMLGDVAVQAERLQALVTWRDPRATGLFLVMCVGVAMMLYLVPSRVVTVVGAFYYLRHPLFRDRRPSRAFNFFRRLPSQSERII